MSIIFFTDVHMRNNYRPNRALLYSFIQQQHRSCDSNLSNQNISKNPKWHMWYGNGEKETEDIPYLALLKLTALLSKTVSGVKI